MKKIFVPGILCFFIHIISFAQENQEMVKAKLIQNTFEQYEYTKPVKRKFISLKNKSLIAKMNPVNYLAAGLLFFYQNLLSEQIQANCNYEISCSSFTKLSIEKYGFVKGTLLGLNQLSCCMDVILYDYPKYKISKDSKIINRFEGEK